MIEQDMIICSLLMYFNFSVIFRSVLGDSVTFDIPEASVACVLLFCLPPIPEIFAHQGTLFKPVRTTLVDAFVSA